MADKKIDKKAIKKAAKEAAKEAEIISKLPLSEQLVKKRAELLAARQGLGSTLQNPRIIGKIKKDIARILTKINTPSTGTNETPVMASSEATNQSKKGDI